LVLPLTLLEFVNSFKYQQSQTSLRINFAQMYYLPYTVLYTSPPSYTSTSNSSLLEFVHYMNFIIQFISSSQVKPRSHCRQYRMSPRHIRTRENARCCTMRQTHADVQLSAEHMQVSAYVRICAIYATVMIHSWSMARIDS